MEHEEFSLDSAEGGAILERFNEVRDQVLLNIHDPNTKPDAKRQVILTMTIVPNASRERCLVSFEVKGKVAPFLPIESVGYTGIDRTTGLAILTEHNPRQARLSFEVSDSDEAETASNVTPMKERK